MTEPDSDPAGTSTPSSRSRARGPGPILDLDPSRVKDETQPGSAPAEGPAGDASAPLETASGSGAGLESEASSSQASAADVPPSAIRPEQASAPRSGGFGRLLGAGLVGGVIGAGLGLAGQQLWRERAGDPVEARLAQVEQRLSGVPSRDALGTLDRRVAASEAALKDASDRAREAQTAAAAASARADEAANRPAPEAPPAPDNAAVEQLAARVSALETEMRNGTQAQGAGIEALGKRISDEDARVAALDTKLADTAKADAARDEALQGRLGEAEKRAQDQGRQLATLAQEGPQRVAAVTQSVDQRVGELTQSVDQRLTKLTQSIDQRLADLAQTVAQQPDRDEVRATARLALVDRVGRALRTGEPYAPALASLRRLGVQGQGRDQGQGQGQQGQGQSQQGQGQSQQAQGQGRSLAALEPFAAKGAPKAADLAREFHTIADRLRAQTQPAASASASWEDRLKRLASSVVKVQPVEGAANAGSAAADPVAAISAALDRADVPAAAKAWDGLPEPAREGARDFGTRLGQRAAAEEAVDGLSRDAVAALDSSTQ